jgi:hypothetical protein
MAPQAAVTAPSTKKNFYMSTRLFLYKQLLTVKRSCHLLKSSVFADSWPNRTETSILSAGFSAEQQTALEIYRQIRILIEFKDIPHFAITRNRYLEKAVDILSFFHINGSPENVRATLRQKVFPAVDFTPEIRLLTSSEEAHNVAGFF